jgi:diadenylate cyclase
MTRGRDCRHKAVAGAGEERTRAAGTGFKKLCVQRLHEDMLNREQSRVDYETSQELMDLLRYTCESLSLGFDRWEEQYVSGPSLYFLVVADVDFEQYTDPLGANKWPIDRCGVVSESAEPFIDVAHDVAFSCDGAVVVAGDGTIQEQMVRVRSPDPDVLEETGQLSYADWMGTKHLSATEISTRDEVLWAVTLSEENGRVTSFLNGSYQDYPRKDIGGRWRPQ